MENFNQQQQPMRVTNLTPKRQELLRIFQKTGWGSVEGLVFQNGDPVLRPPPKIKRDFPLGKGRWPQSGSRPSGDFELTKKHIDFFDFLTERQDGSIDRIEIHDGLPAKMSVEEVASSI